MKLVFSKYPQVVVSLVQERVIQLKISIHKVEVMELNGWHLFFHKGDCFLKCEHYVPTKESKLIIKSASLAEAKNRINSIVGVRKRIYERDNYKCLRCGEKNIKKLTLDHIIPKSKGGKNTYDNYQTLCRKCNLFKGNRNSKSYIKIKPTK